MKKCIILFCKAVLTIVLAAVSALAIMSISPIYRFAGPEPFSGGKIYNPYSGISGNPEWKRACLHTHTRVDKGINECPYYPDVVYGDYMSYGYDIVGFSNHQALTPHPVDTSLGINVYEHGYNILKFHLNPYGVEKVRKFDHILPILRSQKQFMIDLLSKDGDFVQFNHPDRTLGIDRKTMQSLTGYTLIEGDSGFQEGDRQAGTSLKHWDEALSAGRYCHNIANDDNHNSKAHGSIARRCSWINTPTPYWRDVREALLKGDFYSMRVPDFGKGDTAIKREYNLRLPRITSIGLRGDTVFMELSARASIIKAITYEGRTADSVTDSGCINYVMKESDPYIRLTAWFDDGTVIYSNAFARYSEGNSPFRVFPHPVDIPVTVLFNLALFCIAALCIFCIYRLYRKPAAGK